MGVVPGPSRSRLTVALAVAAIVVTVAVLVAGFVAAPSGEAPAEGEESSTAATSRSSTTTSTPNTTGTGHTEEHQVVVDTATVGADERHVEHDTAATPDRGAAHPDEQHFTPALTIDPTHGEHATAPTTVTPGASAPPVEGHAGHEAPSATTTTTTPTTTAAPAPLPAAAQDLIASTRAALADLPHVAAVEAAGYAADGDAVVGYRSFVADPYVDDDAELDADRIEAILVRDGIVVAATFVLRPGATLADAPDIAGPSTPWRDHDGRCWEGDRVVAVAASDGSCPRGHVRIGPPRLQVWLVDPACGPFSPLDCVT
jgi:hypothetical protein